MEAATATIAFNAQQAPNSPTAIPCDHRVEHLAPAVSAVDVARSQRAPLQVSRIRRSRITEISMPRCAAFVVNVAAIRNQLTLWLVGDTNLRNSPLQPVKGYEPDNPVVVVRRVLEKCPNELPAIGPHGLDFIADDEFRGILLRDLGSTEEALANNEYKAATVLAASVIEALLLWALSQPSRKTPVDASKAGSKLLGNASRWGCAASVPSDAPEYGDLGSYLDIVQEIGGVIPKDTFALANTARNFRNLIHPGRAQRTAAQCDRATALATIGALVS
jgi:hypothetical protein